MTEQRASDAEREAAVERLRAATAEGRLDHEELEERVSAAYAARTLSEIDALTADVPPLPAKPAPPPPREPVLRNEHVRRRMATFVSANLICIAIWAATGANASFWPKWVLLATGIGLVVALTHAVFGVEDEQRDELRRPPRPPRIPR